MVHRVSTKPPQQGGRGPKELTGLVDLTRDSQGRTHARLLDLVPGRSGETYKTWLRERGSAFRLRVEIATLDPFHGYKNAIDDQLQDARSVLDAFHVVKLAAAVVDEVRRRVQQEINGHRGRRNDPLYRIRNLLAGVAQIRRSADNAVVHPGRVVDRALAVGHLLVSVAAVVLVVAWWNLGTVPEGELQGLLAFVAVALVPPTSAFLLMAVACARRAFKKVPAASLWSPFLGMVETALGALLTVIHVRSVPEYRTAAVWRLVHPSAALLALGLATLGVAGWREWAARASATTSE